MSTGTVTAFAPGRVSLLGGRPGATRGLALSFAIDRGVTARLTTLPGPLLMARSREIGETDVFDAWRPGAEHAPPGWRRVVRTTVQAVAGAGHRVPPGRLELDGNVPRGGGLGWSAALASAVALTLLGLAGDEEPDRGALARALADADGGVAPYVPLMARPAHALVVDLAAGTAEPVPLALGGWTVAVVGTDVRRAPGEPPAVPEDLADDADDEHVRGAAAALRAGDVAALGPLMDASDGALGAGSPEVRRAVERCRAAGAAGVRRIGGGRVLGLFPPGVPPPRGSLAVGPSAGARSR